MRTNAESSGQADLDFGGPPQVVARAGPRGASITYEDYLGLSQDAQPPVRRYKKIRDEVERQEGLERWLQAQAPDGVHLITDVQEARELVVDLERATVGFDIETAKGGVSELSVLHALAGLLPEASRPRLVQIYDGAAVYVIDAFATGIDWLPLLASVKLVIHNAAFELDHLLPLGLDPQQPFEDTLLADRLLCGRRRRLLEVARGILGVTISKSLQVSDWSRDVLLPEQIAYAAIDAVVARKAWFALWDEMQEHDLLRAYGLLKGQLLPIATRPRPRLDLVAFQEVALGFDRDETQARQALLEQGLVDPLKVSEKQQWLVERLEPAVLLQWPRTGKADQLQMNKDAIAQMEELADDPVLASLVKFTQAHARMANFGLPVLDKLWARDQIVANYGVAEAPAGRYGCTNFNLQAVPREGYKHLILPPQPGWVFVAADLSQIELRIAATFAQEENMLAALRDGVDLHSLTAARMAGVPVEEIGEKDPRRKAAKAPNFGLLYGMGVRTLRIYAASKYNVHWTVEEAAQVHKAWFDAYPALERWQRECVAQARLYGYVTTQWSGLKWWKPAKWETGRDFYSHAMNHPVQGAGFEMLALAIRYVYDQADPHLRLSHWVHDELVLTCPRDHEGKAARLLSQALHHAARTVLPGMPTRDLVEVMAGDTWEAASDKGNIVYRGEGAQGGG